MKKVVIVDAVRTPVGAYLGALKTVPVEELATLAVNEILKRTDLSGTHVDEVILGHVISSADAGNIARVTALAAGLESTPAFTVNRICASGIQAVISAAMEIQTGNADVIIAGGAESLSRVPYYLPLSVRYEGFRNMNKTLKCANEEHAKYCQPVKLYPGIDSMGITAENIVEKYHISREDQDLFAYNSQMKAKRAMESGRFAEEIVPVEVKTKKESVIVKDDEHPRPGTTLEALSKLKPAFKENGTVTAGNSSGLNDGAAAILMMSEDKCKELGLKPMAYVGEYGSSAISPYIMGMGPVEAIQKLLKRTNLRLSDIDLLEINEAFAGQMLGVCTELGNYMGTPLHDRLNVNGGAVALGHPLGMSGARLITTLVYEFRHRDAKYAIASACIGGGQGLALLLEKPQ